MCGRASQAGWMARVGGSSTLPRRCRCSRAMPLAARAREAPPLRSSLYLRGPVPEAHPNRADEQVDHSSRPGAVPSGTRLRRTRRPKKLSKSSSAVAAAPLDHCQDKKFMASMQGRPSRGQGLAGNRAAPCAVRRPSPSRGSRLCRGQSALHSHLGGLCVRMCPFFGVCSRGSGAKGFWIQRRPQATFRPT